MNVYKESVKKIYFAYLIPTMIGAISNSIYVIVDVYFISKGAGTHGIAALNIAFPLFTIYSSIGLLFGVGGATVMAVAEGSKEHHTRNKAFTLSIVFMLFLGLLISIFGTIFVEPIALILGANETLLPYVIEYMIPINISAVAFVLMYSSSILMRADHAPKLAMYALMIGNFSNIVLDYVFVIIIKGGIFGAAFATALSPVITITIMSFHFILKKNTVFFVRDFLDKNLLKRTLSNGLGSAMIDLSAGTVIFIFNALILQMAGNIALAAYAIITNIAYVIKGLLNGFSQAAQPIISLNFGANNLQRVREIVKLSIFSSLLFVTLVYILFFVFAEEMANIFAQEDDSELINIAARGIRIYFASIFFMTFNTMYLNYYQAVEQGKLSSFLAFCKGIIFILFSILIVVPAFALDGIWLCVLFAEGLCFIIILYLTIKHKFPRLEDDF